MSPRIPPPDEPVILADLRPAEAELEVARDMADVCNPVRVELLDTDAKAEDALMNGTPFKPPKWLSPAASDPRRAIEEIGAALAALDDIQRYGTRTRELPDALTRLRPAIDWRFVTPCSPEHLASLRERVEELEAELDARRKGPGEPKPYRLLSGSHSLWEGDKATGRRQNVEAGAEVMLTDWQAANLGDRVQPI